MALVSPSLPRAAHSTHAPVVETVSGVSSAMLHSMTCTCHWGAAHLAPGLARSHEVEQLQAREHLSAQGQRCAAEATRTKAITTHAEQQGIAK
jgi:hypothetical protein